MKDSEAPATVLAFIFSLQGQCVETTILNQNILSPIKMSCKTQKNIVPVTHKTTGTFRDHRPALQP